MKTTNAMNRCSIIHAPEKIKQMYKEIDVNEMESLVGAKFVKLFTDIDLNDDEVISIFVFDKSIK